MAPENTTTIKKEAPQWKGYLLLILAAFLVAWQTPFVTILQHRGVPAIGTVTMLFVVADVLINLVDVFAGKIGAVYKEGLRHLKVLVPLGIFNFFMSFGLFYSLKTLDAGMAAVLIYLAPVFVGLFFLVTKIRPVSGWQRVAIGICILGCMGAENVFLLDFGQLPMIGILFGALSGASLGAYTLYNDLLVPQEMDQLTVITFVLNTGALLSIFVYPGMFVQFLALHLADVAIFVYLAGVTKISCLLLILAGTRRIGAARSSVVQSMEIPFTLVVAFITLHQMMSIPQLIGAGLVIVSVALMQKN